MTTLGREIKKARAVLGMKQLDLHTVTGISQKYLSRIENDRADPGWKVVLCIARALELNLQAFVTDAYNPPGADMPAALRLDADLSDKTITGVARRKRPHVKE